MSKIINVNIEALCEEVDLEDKHHERNMISYIKDQVHYTYLSLYKEEVPKIAYQLDMKKIKETDLLTPILAFLKHYLVTCEKSKFVLKKNADKSTWIQITQKTTVKELDKYLNMDIEELKVYIIHMLLKIYIFMVFAHLIKKHEREMQDLELELKETLLGDTNLSIVEW